MTAYIAYIYDCCNNGEDDDVSIQNTKRSMWDPFQVRVCIAASASESNYKPGPKFCAAITPPDKYEQALI